MLRNLPALGLALVLAGAATWLIALVQDRTQLQGELAAANIEQRLCYLVFADGKVRLFLICRYRYVV